MGNKDSILNIILNIVKQGTGAKDAQNDLGSLENQVSKLGTAILTDVVGFTTLAGAGIALFNELKDDIAAAAEAETTMSRLGATVQSTGRSSETSTVQIHQMADGMRGLFTTEDIERATNELMRFMDIPTSQIPADLALIQNMAAGLGISLPQAADTLGMALETGRLRGLGFSREMQNQISTMMTHGQMAAADALIMEELNAKFSGQAAAALETYAGKQQVISSNFQEMKDTVGNYFLPALKEADDAVIAFFNDLNAATTAGNNTQLQTYQDSLAAVTKAYNDLLDSIGDTGPTDQQRFALEHMRFEMQYDLKAIADLRTQMGLGADTTNDLSENSLLLARSQRSVVISSQDLTISTKDAAAALKEQNSEYQFLNNALNVISGSDKTIKDIEDQITVARKQGYSDAGKHITDLKTKLADAQEAERVSMLKMVDQWIFTTSVLGSKDPKVFQNYMDMEVAQGLITQAEADSATAWLKYAETVANNPVNGTVTIHHVNEYSGVGGSVSPHVGQAGGIPVVDVPPEYGAGGTVKPNTAIWNESASSRPEVFVSGGGYILTKQDAQAALAGGGGAQFVVNYSPMISFADEHELRERLLPLIQEGVREARRGTNH
jgi:hypothetical protein